MRLFTHLFTHLNYLHTFSNSFSYQCNDIAQRLKVAPSYIITCYLAGGYFQALRNIIALVRHQRLLIIALDWEYSS